MSRPDASTPAYVGSEVLPPPRCCTEGWVQGSTRKPRTEVAATASFTSSSWPYWYGAVGSTVESSPPRVSPNAPPATATTARAAAPAANVVRRRWRRSARWVMSAAWWVSGGAAETAASIRSVRWRGMVTPSAHEQIVVRLPRERGLEGLQAARGLGLHGAL